MRNLTLLAVLACAPAVAHADGPALEVGAHAGVFVFDQLDVPRTNWYLVPRVGYWFNHNVGLELDVGLSAGPTRFTDHGFFLAAPQLLLVGNPIPEDKNAPVQPIVTIGAGAALKNVDDAGVRGADIAGLRAEALASVGTGVLVPIVGPLKARTDLRMAASAARENDLYENPFLHFTWTAGLEAHIGLAKDTDKDKVPDKIDLCITEPEDVDGFEDEDGCPDPDNDVDTIPDTTDGCPLEAEDPDEFEDTDGCPDPDNDADGVLDADDTCPMEAGTEATGGCPDGDGDAIADKDDRCPTEAGLEAFEGCPDTDEDGLADPDDECPTEAGPERSFGCPDADEDRVPDHRDACPDEAAAASIDPMRSDGCPSRVYVTADSIVITEKVYFASGSDRIRSNSFGLLDDVAKVLLQYPTIKKVRVEGHTDDRGDDAMNKDLSQRRAQAVVDYLVKDGVEASRLVAVGYGEEQPVATNETSAGRATNRRVAFTILEQETRKILKKASEVAPGEDATPVEE